MLLVNEESDLRYVRFKLEPTYSCYLCKWIGGDTEIGREHKTDTENRGYFNNKYYSLFCPKCFNELLVTEYQKFYYG